MTDVSTIPAAWDALVQLAEDYLATDVAVVDGPPIDWAHLQTATDAVSERLFLFVGAQPGDDTGATGDQSFSAAGNVARDETGAITCTAYAYSGDPDVKARRAEAFGLVAGLETALRTDPSLGGVVLQALVGSVSSVAVRQTRQGSDCQVVFAVVFRSYLS